MDKKTKWKPGGDDSGKARCRKPPQLVRSVVFACVLCVYCEPWQKARCIIPHSFLADRGGGARNICMHSRSPERWASHAAGFSEPNSNVRFHLGCPQSRGNVHTINPHWFSFVLTVLLLPVLALSLPIIPDNRSLSSFTTCFFLCFFALHAIVSSSAEMSGYSLLLWRRVSICTSMRQLSNLDLQNASMHLKSVIWGGLVAQ